MLPQSRRRFSDDENALEDDLIAAISRCGGYGQIYLSCESARARPFAILRAEVFESWGFGLTATVADLSTTTVAALIPSDWVVSICDERIDVLDLNHPASVIGITGKISQAPRMIELAREFRQRGKVVMIGGPHASLNPDALRPYADIIVTGELEDIADKIFSDLSSGTWASDYQGGRPDLKTSPVPRWDLYSRGRALAAAVQTSRGCPFECEFCDVPQYLGRKQRWKEPDQIIRELEVLYARGARMVFLPMTTSPLCVGEFESFFTG